MTGAFSAGTALMAIGLAAVGVTAIAQAQPVPTDPTPRPGMTDPGSPQRRTILAEADLTALKASLNLRPDQADLWARFESAARGSLAAFDEAKLARPDRAADTDNGIAARADRMLRMADGLRSRGEALKALDERWKALQAGLDDPQRATANVLGDRLLRELSGAPGAGMSPHMGPLRGGERGPGPSPGQRM